MNNSMVDAHAQHKLDLWVQDEPKRLKKFLLKLALRVNTHHSLLFHSLLEKDDFSGISTLDNSFLTTYPPLRDAKFDYFFSEVLSKQAIWPMEEASIRSNRTFEKFHAVEEHCYHVNHRFYSIRALPFRTAVESCIFSMQRKIAHFCDFNFDDKIDYAVWGPGVTKTIRGRYTSANKIGEFPFQVNTDAWKLYSNFLSKFPGYLRLITSANGVIDEESICGEFCPTIECFILDDVEKLVNVPKTSKSDRTITICSTGLAQLSAAYGNVLRRRLNSIFNVDLRLQEVNQTLANDYNNCTIDLSSASDSLTIGLVNHLFPQSIADLLTSLRTPYYHSPLDDKVHAFNKFAGMGNGITFPLQTLIFHTAALAVCEYLGIDSKSVNTYGDDIIVPNACYDLLSILLRDLGFNLNIKKSHRDSDPLRESCGAHYIYGEDAKPVYLKQSGHDFETCIRNHNRFFRYFARQDLFEFVDLLGILRWNCPVYSYQEISFDYKRFKLGTGLLTSMHLNEEDKHFYVFMLPKIKAPYYTACTKPQYCATKPNKALWLKHLDMYTSTRIGLVSKRIRRLPSFKDVLRKFAFEDQNHPREYSPSRDRRTVYIRC